MSFPNHQRPVGRGSGADTWRRSPSGAPLPGAPGPTPALAAAAGRWNATLQVCVAARSCQRRERGRHYVNSPGALGLGCPRTVGADGAGVCTGAGQAREDRACSWGTNSPRLRCLAFDRRSLLRAEGAASSRPSASRRRGFGRETGAAVNALGTQHRL